MQPIWCLEFWNMTKSVDNLHWHPHFKFFGDSSPCSAWCTPVSILVLCSGCACVCRLFVAEGCGAAAGPVRQRRGRVRAHHELLSRHRPRSQHQRWQGARRRRRLLRQRVSRHCAQRVHPSTERPHRGVQLPASPRQDQHPGHLHRLHFAENCTRYRHSYSANAHRPTLRLDLTVTSGVTCGWMARGSHSFTCHPHVYPPMEWAILHAFRKHSRDGFARTMWHTSGSAYYSSIDPEMTKGWVGLVGWPHSGWFTHISGHPAAIGRAWDRESSPVKKTDVLSLCHAAKKVED